MRNCYAPSKENPKRAEKPCRTLIPEADSPMLPPSHENERRPILETPITQSFWRRIQSRVPHTAYKAVRK